MATRVSSVGTGRRPWCITTTAAFLLFASCFVWRGAQAKGAAAGPHPHQGKVKVSERGAERKGSIALFSCWLCDRLLLRDEATSSVLAAVGVSGKARMCRMFVQVQQQ